MKRMQMILFGLVLLTGNALAESRYISEQLEVTLRTGPGTDRKIIAMIKSGQPLELVEPGEKWSRVRLPGGKEGWVITRFLSSTVPSGIKLQRLEEKHAALSERAATLETTNKTLSEENRALSETLESNQGQLKQLDHSYTTLKKDSAQFLKIKSNYDRVTTKLTKQTAKAEALQHELDQIKRNQFINKFLAGAGVLLVGFIIGFITKRQKRRSSLL